MLHRRSLVWAALLSFTLPAAASTALSHDSSNLLESAESQARHGSQARAKAALESLLMTRGVTVGMGDGEGMPEAIAHAVATWNQRLPGSPLHFTSNPGADFTVRFVTSISGEGDLQGQIHVQRYIRWGLREADYKVHGTILVCDQIEGRELNEEEAAAVVEHELGHLLGLDDDEREGVLMGPFVPGEPVDGPSPEEVAKVAALRSDARKLLASVGSGDENVATRSVDGVRELAAARAAWARAALKRTPGTTDMRAALKRRTPGRQLHLRHGHRAAHHRHLS